MSRRERERGKRGEREVRDLERKYGFEARRGIASAGEPDVVSSLPGIHREVKYTERFELWAAIRQATEDAKPGEEPVVVFRRNHEKWRGILDYEELLKLWRLRETAREFVMDAGSVFDDPRLDYVEIQVTRAVWEELREVV